METIELKDFVQRTLVDVVKGVKGANQELKDCHFVLECSIGDLSRSHRGIEFDIALMAEKGAKESAGFKVALLNLGGKGGVEKATQHQFAHRIKFEVTNSMTIG